MSVSITTLTAIKMAIPTSVVITSSVEITFTIDLFLQLVRLVLDGRSCTSINNNFLIYFISNGSPHFRSKLSSSDVVPELAPPNEYKRITSKINMAVIF